jgi:hypothetical protein
VSHLLTPETETTTHYFWTFTRDSKLDDDDLSERLRTGISQAFMAEDAPIIEWQQRYAPRADQPPPRDAFCRATGVAHVPGSLLSESSLPGPGVFRGARRRNNTTDLDKALHREEYRTLCFVNFTPRKRRELPSLARKHGATDSI